MKQESQCYTCHWYYVPTQEDDIDFCQLFEISLPDQQQYPVSDCDEWQPEGE